MGGRASPPTQRVVDVLDFLARHPHDRFGVSELARRVGQSKPTCLGIVITLAESGYLVREKLFQGHDLCYKFLLISLHQHHRVPLVKETC